MNQKPKTTQKPKSKTTVEVHDLKPSKDAKGGGGGKLNPTGGGKL
jgi:hypothetical protein